MFELNGSYSDVHKTKTKTMPWTLPREPNLSSILMSGTIDWTLRLCLHSTQSFLRYGPHEQVKHFHLRVHPCPFKHLEKSHLERVVLLPVVVPSSDVAVDRFAIRVDHLSTSDNLANLFSTGR